MKAFIDAGGEKKGIKRKADKSAKKKKDPAAPKEASRRCIRLLPCQEQGSPSLKR